MMKFLGSTERVIDKDKYGENEPKLEIMYVILMHCNIVNSNYQQASKLLFTFVSDKHFSQLITIAPHSLTILKTTIAEFSFKYGLQIKIVDNLDNVNITLMTATG